MTKTYCDICKKEVDESFKLEFRPNTMSNVGLRVYPDTCTDCKGKIQRFITSISK